MDLGDIEALRPFVRDGKLVAMPRRHSKRQVLLDWLAQQFEPGFHYTEAEVNGILIAIYPDYATLRRSLIDAGLLDRQGGVYWRSGGEVT